MDYERVECFMYLSVYSGGSVLVDMVCSLDYALYYHIHLDPVLSLIINLSNYNWKLCRTSWNNFYIIIFG